MSSIGVTVQRLPTRRRWRESGLSTAARYLAGRLGQGLLVVFGAVLISFVLVNLAGDSVASRAALLTPAQVHALEHQLGLDRPLLERFVHYIDSVLHGNFGASYRFGGSALDVVMSVLPNTLALVGASLVVVLALGVPAALYSAIRPGSRVDRMLGRATSLLQGIPEFWLALMLVIVFAVNLGWLPSIGFDGPSVLLLPAIAIATPLVPAVYRLLRGQLLDVMQRDFVEVLRIKGLSERQIVLRHGLRNALPGFVAFFGLQLGYLIGGTLVVEVVFSWPGIGSLAVDAANAHDLGVVQAVVIVVAFAYVLLNLLADLLVLWLDPRVRTGSR